MATKKREVPGTANSRDVRKRALADTLLDVRATQSIISTDVVNAQDADEREDHHIGQAISWIRTHIGNISCPIAREGMRAALAHLVHSRSYDAVHDGALSDAASANSRGQTYMDEAQRMAGEKVRAKP